jgi:hypothetical protein
MVLWPVIGRREKAVVLTVTVFICAVSFLSPRLESLTTAIDEGSATRRFAMINESSTDHRLLMSIDEIDSDRFAAEKEFALGTVKLRMGLYDQARDHLLASVSRRSDFAPAYLNLGNVYFRQGDFNRALAGYQSVIDIDSTCALAWFNIGQTYINKMLFAQSSDALARAREFGIEKYNEAHPATSLIEFDIYDRGFPIGELWRIAFVEAGSGKAKILDGIFRPYLLFPLRWVWIVMIAAVAAGIILARAIPRSWLVYFCSNCSLPTCTECSDSETGITLCHNCAAAISGLSSIKVMEALLRHRRQKVRSRKGRGGWWKMKILPGSSMIIRGSAWKGIFLMSAATSALFLLLWNGSYLGDPRNAGLGSPLIQQVTAITIIVLCWLLTIISRNPREQMNYRILPPTFSVKKPEKRKPHAPQTLELGEMPAETKVGPIMAGRRRFTEQDSKTSDAFKEYLETL